MSKTSSILSHYESQNSFPDYVYAKYNENEAIFLPEEYGNPLIRALPEQLKPIKIKERINTTKLYYEDTLEWPIELKIRSLKKRFSSFFMVFHDFIFIGKELNDILYNGLTGRSPIITDNIKKLYYFDDTEYELLLKKLQTSDNEDNLISGFMSGVSGTGKSSIIKKNLSLYPKAIIHPSKFMGIKFPITPYIQIVYIYIAMPPLSSKQSFFLAFFKALDEILDKIPGLHESEKNWLCAAQKAKNHAQLQVKMLQACSRFSIGCIVIDELQRVSLQRSGGTDEITEFFVSIMSSGIPVILVGLTHVEKLFSNDVTLARRCTTYFRKKIRIYKEKDSEWLLLVNEIFSQDNLHEIDIRCDIASEIHKYTRGIVFLLVKFAKHIYEILITKQEKIITAELIKEIYIEEFSLLSAPLAMLDKGDESLFCEALEAILEENSIENCLDRGSLKKDESDYDINGVSKSYDYYIKNTGMIICESEDDLHAALLKKNITYDSEKFKPLDDI
ncbi:ATP-binding protein [Endozoicomonas euniceicola]|uniref:ATP-binding protein n=1 Tax=Endozoicomonas euniceicola TaxID=1234143 RepID=A0ABY6GRS4_9GAMM|nr:ATP-binding protein [Endozoicomonas euniceicola]UYM15455.1 ATP-binding protein [Endozoicomonas euniceicola]